jgi:hypothetical protein
MSHIIPHYSDEATIWRAAWHIAEPGASNPVAVARTLYAASAFLLHDIGTDGVRKHPALRLIAAQLSYLYNVDALGGSPDDTPFINQVKSVVNSLDAGKDLDVAITDANADLEANHG